MKYLIALFLILAFIDLPYYDQLFRSFIGYERPIFSLSSIEGLPVTIESQCKKIEILEMLSDVDNDEIKELSDSLEVTKNIISELETRLINCQNWHQKN